MKRSEMGTVLSLVTGIRDEYVTDAAEKIPQKEVCVRLNQIYGQAAGEAAEQSADQLTDPAEEKSCPTAGRRILYFGIGIAAFLLIAAACISSFLFGEEGKPINQPKTVDGVDSALLPGIGKEERLLLLTPEGTYFVDQNGAVTDVLKDCVYSDQSLAEREKTVTSVKELQILRTDDEDPWMPWRYGLYSLELHQWVILQEYDRLLAIDGEERWYKGWKGIDEERTGYILDIIDASDPSKPVIRSSYELDTIDPMNAAGCPYISDGKSVWDLMGNLVYQPSQYRVAGLNGHVAVLGGEKYVFYDLKEEKIIGETEKSEISEISGLVDFSQEWYCFDHYMVNYSCGIVFHCESGAVLDADSLAERNREDSAKKEWLAVCMVDPETEEIILCCSKSMGDTMQPKNKISVYVCDMEGNCRAVYNDLLMVHGRYGLYEKGEELIRRDLFSGEEILMPPELNIDSYTSMVMLSRDWILMDSKAPYNKTTTICYRNKIITDQCVDNDQNQYGLWIGIYEEKENEEPWIHQTWYRNDGKVFEGELASDELVYLSDQEIAVYRQGKIRIMDWDGKELVSIPLSIEETPGFNP